MSSVMASMRPRSLRNRSTVNHDKHPSIVLGEGWIDMRWWLSKPFGAGTAGAAQWGCCPIEALNAPPLRSTSVEPRSSAWRRIGSKALNGPMCPRKLSARITHAPGSAACGRNNTASRFLPSPRRTSLASGSAPARSAVGRTANATNSRRIRTSCADTAAEGVAIGWAEEAVGGAVESGPPTADPPSLQPAASNSGAMITVARFARSIACPHPPGAEARLVSI